MWQHLALVQQLHALRLRLEEDAGRMTQAAAQERQNPVVRERGSATDAQHLSTELVGRYGVRLVGAGIDRTYRKRRR